MVAECMQGYILKLITEKVVMMSQLKEIVLLDGHPATLAFIDTPHKFQLVLDNSTLTGQWATAKVIARKAAIALSGATSFNSCQAVVEQTLEVLGSQDVDEVDLGWCESTYALGSDSTSNIFGRHSRFTRFTPKDIG